MNRPILMVLGLGLLVGISARAQPNAAVQLDMCLSGKGMAPELLTRAHRHFVSHLRSLKVEFVAPVRQGNCCTSSSCLGEEAVQLGAQGILNIEMLRVGPMVQATFYLFDAVTVGCPCPADLVADGTVDVNDLLFLLANWGTPDGDVTGDLTTDVDDLLAILAAWGPCSP